MPPESTILTPSDLLGLDHHVAHLEEYFGIWAILEKPFRTAVDQVAAIDLREHVRIQVEAYDAAGDYPVTAGGVAVVSIVGPMMKYVSSLSGGTSTVLTRRQIRNAAANTAVESILVKIDSPGGTVSGTRDLAEDVAAAAKQKRVVAYVEDMGASAAYWVASQAQAVYANATAMVGSIGTYGVIYDLSAAAEKRGLKVHVLRSGPFKGAGEPGTEVTEEQLAEWQRIVDELNEHFLAGVAAGRRLSMKQVRELADGRVHIGAAAATLKLIDGVKTLDQVVQELSAPSNQQRNKTMSQGNQQDDATPVVAATPETTTPAAAAAASFEQLKESCPGAGSDFICEQLAGKATAEQARAAYMAKQQAENAKLKTELAEARAAGKAKDEKPGVESLGGGTGGGKRNETAGDPVEQFETAVSERMQAGTSRQKAILAVATKDPELHQGYLLGTNDNRRARRLLEEKFDV